MREVYTFLDRLFQKRWPTHTLFWAYVLISAPLFSEFNSQEIGESLIYRGVGLPLKMAAAYLLVYYQIPQLLQKRKYFQFLVSMIMAISLFTVLYRINNIYIAETLAGVTHPKESISQILIEYKFTFYFYFWRVYSAAFGFLLLKMLKDWALNRQQIETLQKEKAEAELNFLKAQLHPHFLFNTLNNLYALALKKADETPEAIAKLADILDYMLYQCNAEKVPLHKEVEVIQDYITLERLRYGSRLGLNFSQKIEDKQVMIAPLVLLSIVENAFKHGVSGIIYNPQIELELETEEGALFFRIFNTRSSNPKQERLKHRNGIGTANIKRQLDLMYPNRYTWETREKEGSYEIKLSIDL